MNNFLKRCNECGSFLTSCSNNVSWEIKWNPRDNIFVFFLYVREINGIRVYGEPIPNYTLITVLNDAKGEELVRWYINRLISLHNINLQ